MNRSLPASLRRRALLVGGTALAAIGPRIARSQSAPVPIRYATGGGIGSSEIETVIFDPAMPRAALPRMGKDYSLNLTYSAGSPQAAAMLASGQVDMTTLSCSALAAALLKDAFPSGLTIVSDNYQDGRVGFASNGFYVLQDSPMKSIGDLRGKTVAINAFGSAVDLVLRVALKRAGMDPKKDLQIVEIGFPNIGSAIRQKRVDCGVLVLPFQAVENSTGGLRTLFSTADVFGPASVIFNVVSNDFLKAHPETVRAFLADYVNGLGWLNQPANHAQAVSVMAGLTKLPAETLAYAFTDKDYYRAPNGHVEAPLIQKPIDALKELGLLNGDVQIAKYVDMQYLPA
jgi:NitT/TauT family transport system substrate-binding protein